MADAVLVRARGRKARAGDEAPVVRRVADAFVDGQAIHWDGADALGRTPRERTLTRELRNLAWLSSQAGVQSIAPAVPYRPPQNALELTLVGAAAGQVLLAAGTMFAYGSPAAMPGAGLPMLSCAAAALALLASRRDVAARRLGHVLWLVAALQACPAIAVLSSRTTLPWLATGAGALHVEAFLPLAMWRLARECPPVVRFTWFDTCSRGVLVAALACSLCLAWTGVRGALGPPDVPAAGQWFMPPQPQAASGVFGTVLAAWASLTVLTLALRLRNRGGGGVVACVGQARRSWTPDARLLPWTLAAGMLLVTSSSFPGRAWVDVAGAAAMEGDPYGSVVWLLGTAVVWPWLVAAPTLWPRAATHGRAPLASLVTRAMPVLGAVSAAALLVPLAALVARRHEPPDHLLVDRLLLASLVVVGLAAASLAMLRAHAAREASRRCLHRGRHGSGVAGVAADVACARTPREIADTLVQHMQAALDSPLAAVVMPSGGAWVPVGDLVPRLPGDSAIAAMLGAAGPPTRIGPGSQLFALLPAADRQWLEATGVQVIARVTQRDGETLAGLLLGARRDGRPHSRRDMAFVAAAVGMTAVALQALTAVQADQRTPHDEAAEELAFECVACGAVGAADRCPCGGRRALSSLPATVAGKFAVERRLGRGGMGVVYLASDTRLGRRVALKTLPHLRPGAAIAMHAEAQAMAAMEHPGVAVLYELHVWRDTPVLVVEHLAGGTLAARLSAGPLPVDEAVMLATMLADTLADLHDGGWVHGDVKPSNIGFGRSGAPKLLDFGLTRLVTHAASQWAGPGAVDAGLDPATRAPLAGTPLYLSPEALDGSAVGAHMDVWALALVLFEMLAGAHPFRAGPAGGIRDARRSRARDVRALAPHVPAPLAHTLASALHPQLSLRIATARELAAALRAVVGAVPAEIVPHPHAC